MSADKSAAILVAAGQGERLAAFIKDAPKQFVYLGNRPLFIWALTVLSEHRAIHHIVLTVPSNWQGRISSLIKEYLPQLNKEIIVIAGGATRQESVHLALEKIAQSNINPEYVFIHDAVRPFIVGNFIDTILTELKKGHAVTLGIPLSDSIKKMEDGLISQDLDRNDCVLVQTPQAARFSTLLSAHRDAKFNKISATDDAAIVKANGCAVKIVPGNKLNFKITEPEDLVIAQSLVKQYNWTPGKVEIKSEVCLES